MAPENQKEWSTKWKSVYLTLQIEEKTLELCKNTWHRKNKPWHSRKEHSLANTLILARGNTFYTSDLQKRRTINLCYFK
jgi:hypothetical protein